MPDRLFNIRLITDNVWIVAMLPGLDLLEILRKKYLLFVLCTSVEFPSGWIGIRPVNSRSSTSLWFGGSFGGYLCT